MTAPRHVPHGPEAAPRRGSEVPGPGHWTADRPADLDAPQPVGPRLGSPGPDQGYVLGLPPLFDDRLQLAGEHRHDVDAGCVAVALKRASLFGRAPVVHDLEIAYRLFGFLDPNPPPELLSARAEWFNGCAHSYAAQRAVADLAPEEVLRLTPAEATQRHAADWRTLLSL